MSFNNKVVIVTGASGGIGAAIAIKFATEHAKVVLVGRNVDKLKIVTERCEQANADCVTIQADITKTEDLKMIIDKAIDKFGKIDILINNAAILKKMEFLNEDFVRSFDEVFSTNLQSVIKLTWLAAPHIIKTKGNIINISSVAGIKQKTPNFIAYSTSKAALDYFSSTLALEMAPHGVRVNVISPGPVRTDIFQTAGMDIDVDNLKQMTYLNRISEPAEIADLALYVASDKAKGMTGSKSVIDNGYLL